MGYKNTGISAIVFLFIIFRSFTLFSQWQVDDDYNFKINIPATWTKTSYAEGTDKIHDFLSPDERIFIEVRAFTSGEGFTSDLLAQVFEESLLQEGKRINFSTTSLNGLTGKMGLYNVKLDGDHFDMLAFYAVTAENSYVIWALTEAGQMQLLRWQIDQIMSTFSLIDLDLLAFEGSLTSGSVNKKPSESKKQPATSNPNPDSHGGANSFVYEGQTYQTVKIGNQTWMAENLNVGKMIVAEQYSGFQSDNKIVEKYCFEDKQENCEKWGGLYMWKEMMQYGNSDNGSVGNVQGICPDGWHLPTDQEWTSLERFVDSDKGISDNNWNKTGTRGTDSGKKLKSKIGWTANQYVPFPNGEDAVGFNVLAVGNKSKNGYYSKSGYNVLYWTATEHEGWKGTAYIRKFSNRFDNVNRVNEDKRVANPVRCVKD